MAAPLRPLHIVRKAAIANRLAIPVVGEGGANAAAGFADRLNRQPAGGALHIADAHVQIANHLRLIKRRTDKRIELPGWVDLGEPVELGANAEARKGWEEERADEVSRVVFGATPFRSRYVCEWHAHVPLHRVGGQERLRIHRIHIFDAVAELHGDAAVAQGTSNGVVHDRPTKAANVHRPRWGLRVVDNLGPGDTCGEFVCPIHAGNPSARGGG